MRRSPDARSDLDQIGVGQGEGGGQRTSGVVSVGWCEDLDRKEHPAPGPVYPIDPHPPRPDRRRFRPSHPPSPGPTEARGPTRLPQPGGPRPPPGPGLRSHPPRLRHLSALWHRPLHLLPVASALRPPEPEQSRTPLLPPPPLPPAHRAAGARRCRPAPPGALPPLEHGQAPAPPGPGGHRPVGRHRGARMRPRKRLGLLVPPRGNASGSTPAMPARTRPARPRGCTRPNPATSSRATPCRSVPSPGWCGTTSRPWTWSPAGTS